MYNEMEMYFLDVVRGKRNGVFARPLRAALRVFSWGFQAVVSIRNWAYDKGVLSRYIPPVPVVISIGNIVAGGTGKTPVTLQLAKTFYEEFLIAILSRGYRSPAEKLPSPIWLSKGNGPMHPPSFCGDEPYLLANKLPKALVFVGKDRQKASNMAAKAGAHVILLDDAMQHRRLARDFDLVVMDAGDPFGQGFFLPRGFLREGAHSLARANLVIVNHVNSYESFLSLKETISKYTKAPIVGTRMEVSNVRSLDGEIITGLQNKSVGVFCGIANSDNFRSTVENLQIKIIASYDVGDHRDFHPEKLQQFSKKCRELGAEYLVCTEKDRVKLISKMDLELPIVWFEMELNIVSGENHWVEFIKNAKESVYKCL